MSGELRKKIKPQLHELRCMSEFAAGLATSLDGNGAEPSFLHIEIGRAIVSPFAASIFSAVSRRCRIR